MSKSITPSMTVTQTGGAQLVIITPNATASLTPAMGNALEAEDQTVVLRP